MDKANDAFEAIGFDIRPLLPLVDGGADKQRQLVVVFKRLQNRPLTPLPDVVSQLKHFHRDLSGLIKVLLIRLQGHPARHKIG